MKFDHYLDCGATPSKFKRASTTETIANGRDAAGGDGWQSRELFKGSASVLPVQITIVHLLRGLSAGLLRRRRMDSFAVGVCYKGDVSEFSKAPRVFTLVVGNAGPGRIDHDSSLLALLTGIVSEITFELAVADFVIDCLHLYLSTDCSRC